MKTIEMSHLSTINGGMSRSGLLTARIHQVLHGAEVGIPKFFGEKGVAHVRLPDGRTGTASGLVYKEAIGLTHSGGLPAQSPKRNVIDLWFSKGLR